MVVIVKPLSQGGVVGVVFLGRLCGGRNGGVSCKELFFGGGGWCCLRDVR